MTTTPMSRRDVWLTVALLVAREDLPEPQGLTLYDRKSISIDVDTQAQGRMWAARLGLTEDAPIRNREDTKWICVWHAVVGDCKQFPGWSLTMHAYPTSLDEPAAPSPLADEVIAAIESPADKPLIASAPELAAAYGLEWPADACPSCGGAIYDGQCYGAEQCEDPKCTRACCAPKRQGPVAAQQAGRGSS